MRRMIGLGLLGIWAAMPAPAWGCLFHPTPPIYSFADLDPVGHAPVNAPGASIALVRTELVETREITRTEMRGLELSPFHMAGGPYHKIRIVPMETIFGEGSEVEERWFPALTEETTARERRYARDDRPFAFWDRMALSNAVAFDHIFHSGGMCHPHHPSGLVPGLTYLRFKRAGNLTAFEPVSGPDHSLVQAMRDHVRGRRSPLLRDGADYVSEMDGYAEIEITACPIGFSDGIDPRIFSMSQVPDRADSPLRYQVRDRFNMAEPLSLGQFPLYQARILARARDRDPHSSDSRFECRVGSRFLVLHRISEHPRIPDGSLDNGRSRRPPSQRFIEYRTFNGAGETEWTAQWRRLDETTLLSRITLLPRSLPEPEEIKAIIRQTVCDATSEPPAACASPGPHSLPSRSASDVCTPRGMECEGVQRQIHASVTLRPGQPGAEIANVPALRRRIGDTLSANPECAVDRMSLSLYLPEDRAHETVWPGVLGHAQTLRQLDGYLSGVRAGAGESDRDVPVDWHLRSDLSWGMRRHLDQSGPDRALAVFRADLKSHPDRCGEGAQPASSP